MTSNIDPRQKETLKLLKEVHAVHQSYAIVKSGDWLTSIFKSTTLNTHTDEIYESIKLTTWVEPGFTMEATLSPNQSNKPSFSTWVYDTKRVPIQDTLRTTIHDDYIKRLTLMLKWLNAAPDVDTPNFECPKDKDITRMLRRLKKEDVTVDFLAERLIEVAQHPQAHDRCPLYMRGWEAYTSLNPFASNYNADWLNDFQNWIPLLLKPPSLEILPIPDNALTFSNVY